MLWMGLAWMAAMGGAAEAGPWVKAPGELYAKAGYVQFRADEFVDPSGATLSGVDYTGHTSHLYGEVGLVGPVQVVFNAPFVGSRNTLGEVAYVNRAFGDLDVGLEAGTTLGDVPVSLQVLTKVPLYDNAELLAYGASGGRFPAIGDGQVDLTALGAVGTGIAAGGFRGWWAAEVGYRHRTEWWAGDASAPERVLVDSIPWHLQLGWSPTFGSWEAGWWSVDAWAVQNLRQSDNTKEWFQLVSSLGARVGGGVALELGYSQMIWGRAPSLGQSLLAGVSFTR